MAGNFYGEAWFSFSDHLGILDVKVKNLSHLESLYMGNLQARFSGACFHCHLSYFEPTLITVRGPSETRYRNYRILTPHCYFLVWFHLPLNMRYVNFSFMSALVANKKLDSFTDDFLSPLPFPNVKSSGVVCDSFTVGSFDRNGDAESVIGTAKKNIRSIVLDFWGTTFTEDYFDFERVPSVLLNAPAVISPDKKYASSFFEALEQRAKHSTPEELPKIDWVSAGANVMHRLSLHGHIVNLIKR